MILSIGKVIYNLLNNDKVLSKAVNKHIYPLIADSDINFPFVVYKRNSIASLDSKDRFIAEEEAIIEVVVASDKYNNSIEIAELVKSALHGKKGLIAGINVKSISLTEAEEDYIENSFIQKLYFKIKVY